MGRVGPLFVERSDRPRSGFRKNSVQAAMTLLGQAPIPVGSEHFGPTHPRNERKRKDASFVPGSAIFVDVAWMTSMNRCALAKERPDVRPSTKTRTISPIPRRLREHHASPAPNRPMRIAFSTSSMRMRPIAASAATPMSGQSIGLVS